MASQKTNKQWKWSEPYTHFINEIETVEQADTNRDLIAGILLVVGLLLAIWFSV